MAERASYTRLVAGSSPAPSTKLIFKLSLTSYQSFLFTKITDTIYPPDNLIYEPDGSKICLAVYDVSESHFSGGGAMLNIDLRGKSAVVTGGAQGIGRSIVTALAQAGARVTFLDVNAPVATRAFEELQAQKLDVQFVHCDTGSRREIDRVTGHLLEDRPIDILILNAGIELPGRGTLLTMTDEDEARIKAVNNEGPFHLTKIVARSMIKREQGAIIFIGSGQGTIIDGAPNIYQVTKGATIRFAQVLAHECAPYGVRVNTVSPGPIRTEGMGNIELKGPEVIAAYRRYTPMRRRGWPTEVAHAVAFMASDLASYITGQNLGVDGGYVTQGTPDSLISDQGIVPEDPDVS